MRHTELTNYIKGSFLKAQYLEAFSVQSMYVESLLRLFLDYHYGELTKEKPNSPLFAVISQNLEKYTMREVVAFLYRAKLISKEQYNTFEEYRESRDEILHALLRETTRDGFEKELRETCELGNNIVESKEFRHMTTLVDYMDKNHRKGTTATGEAARAEVPQLEEVEVAIPDSQKQPELTAVRI